MSTAEGRRSCSFGRVRAEEGGGVCPDEGDATPDRRGLEVGLGLPEGVRRAYPSNSCVSPELLDVGNVGAAQTIMMDDSYRSGDSRGRTRSRTPSSPTAVASTAV